MSITRLVIKLSGGLVKSDQQAQYAMVILAVLFFLATILMAYQLWGSTPSRLPQQPQAPYIDS